MKESVKKKLARNSLTWAGHMETMGDDKLAKRADALKGGKERGKKTEIVMGDYSGPAKH